MGQHFLCVRSRPGQMDGLLHRRHRSSEPPGIVAHHRSDLVCTLSQVHEVDLPTDRFLRLSYFLTDHGIAVAPADAIGQDHKVIICPFGFRAVVIRLYRSFFQAEIRTPALDCSGRSAEHFG